MSDDGSRKPAGQEDGCCSDVEAMKNRVVNAAELEAKWQKEGGEAQREEELKSLQDFVCEVRERIEFKCALRERNLIASDNRPDESFFVKLDSSLKKNTAFVKKLRSMTEGQRDSLIKDFNSLNLTMYIGEMADAIVEAKLKMSDVSCAVTLCSLIHQRYTDFSSLLLDSWHKVLLTKKDDKVPNVSKLRVDLRLFGELIAVGVFTEKEGLPLLANQLTLLTTNDRDEHNNLSIVVCFCRYCGDDYAGLVPRKFTVLAAKYGVELPRSQLLPSDRQRACRNLLKDYFASLCKHLLTDWKQLRSTEKQNRRILQTKGELTNERKEKWDTLQQNFHKLLSTAQTLADLLDEDVPSLPVDELKTDADCLGLDAVTTVKGSAEFLPDGDASLYDDDETRQFYENLPDLKAIIPGILYKDSEQQAAAAVSDAETSTVVDDVTELDEEDMVLMAEAAGDTSHHKKVDDAVVDEYEAVVPGDLEDDDTDMSGASMKLQLETFLTSLPHCVSRDLIDKAAEEFCMNMNTTVNRRKLVRALFFVHRTRYDLLPFYARFVASLHPCMPNIAADLSAMLKADFRYHVRKKDQMNIESKLKNVRFIGELVKFNMFAKSEALNCVKMLLFDFTHHNIEMACALLETCGRYLYRTADSHQRVKVYLDVMMRKKTVQHLDSRYATMIENAYYYSNPPSSESRQEVRIQLPPMHQYICRLLYKDLSKSTIERVLRQMRKLDWDDSEVREFAISCLTSMYNVRYNNIQCCANLLAGLAPYQEAVSIQVIDGVLEDITLGLELNQPKYNQRRVSSVHYLGELYNYRMVESNVIFHTLYLFITFGVSLDDTVPSSLDPPEHLFRIRLVCVLLDTCGQYFDRGSSKKKLDCFLIYFQRYFWHKKRNTVWTAERPFPRDVEYLFCDTLEQLRPKLHAFTSWDEASDAADAQDKELASKLVELVKPQDSADMSLSVIHESSEQEMSADTMDDSDRDMRSDSPGLSQKGDGMAFDEVDDDDDDDDDDDMNILTNVGSHEDSRLERDDYFDSDGDDDDETNSPADVQATRAIGLRHIKCAEDDDFLAALDKMMSDSLQARSQELMKVPAVDIAVPLNVRAQTKSKPPTPPTLSSILPSPSAGALLPLQQSVKCDDVIDDVSTAGTDKVAFTVLSKRGNKQQFAVVNIPRSESIAAKFMEQIELEKIEKERMKRVVLNIHERQEEEDYQEMLAQLNRQLPSNVNRDRRVPYQHPKGAPDADAIFGSKKR